MFEIKKQLERNERFRTTLRKNLAAATGGRKDKPDVLRTALWFAEIKNRLNASTAYEVERHLEPEAFGRNQHRDHFHRNKWPKYSVGTHTPNEELAASVDIVLPGTERLLNHVLWETLSTNQWTEQNINRWLRQLIPDIQKILFQTDRHTPGNNSRRGRLSRQQLKMLERRAGIDSLACLTILLRDTCDQGEQSIVLDLGTSLYRILLILCTTVPIGDFAFELLDIYRERIFSLVRHKGSVFRFENFDFIEAVHLLRTLLLALEDNNQIGIGWDDSVRAICKLLDGNYGFDIKFALDPPIGPDGPLTNFNADAYRDFERQERFRRWGKRNIMSGNIAKFPPEHLW